jgi:polyferredoxin
MFGRRSPRLTSEERDRRERHVFHSRPRHPLRARQAVQFGTFAVIAYTGWRFVQWVHGLEAGVVDGARAPGVEGFLPIASLISLRHWIETGTVNLVHPAGLVLLCLILLTAVLLKKAFCSWLCPVGTVAEYLARLSHKVLKRRLKLPSWLDWPLQSLKYLLLLFFVNAIFFLMSRQQIAQFLDLPYNKVSDIKMLYFFTDPSATTLWVLGILTLLSLIVPWFWCRYLCPYGALLGLVSLLSPLKVVRTPAACTSCRQCAAVCPSFLAVDLKTTVNAVECTGCLECVAACPEGDALQLRPVIGRLDRWKVRPAIFAVLVVVLFYGGIQTARLAGVWRGTTDQRELVERVRRGLSGPEYDHVGRPTSAPAD